MKNSPIPAFCHSIEKVGAVGGVVRTTVAPSGDLSLLHDSCTRVQMGPNSRGRAFNQGSIRLVAKSVSGTPYRPGENLVAFSRDPALAIWQAMKPLAEVGARTDAPDAAKIITEAEIILFGLVRALSRRLENSESTVAADAIEADAALGDLGFGGRRRR